MSQVKIRFPFVIVYLTPNESHSLLNEWQSQRGCNKWMNEFKFNSEKKLFPRKVACDIATIWQFFLKQTYTFFVWQRPSLNKWTIKWINSDFCSQDRTKTEFRIPYLWTKCPWLTSIRQFNQTFRFPYKNKYKTV